jgi:hypothetical protein
MGSKGGQCVIATGGWINNQTIGFVTTTLQDSALKWYVALSSRVLDNKAWEVVKTQLIKSYGTQINTTAACKGISKLYQGSKWVLDYFSEVIEVCKVLIKLTPEDYRTVSLSGPQNHKN